MKIISLPQRDLQGRFVALSFRRPFLVVGVLLLIGAISTVVASRLAFRGSFVELLPENAREVTDLQQVAAKAGGDGYLVVQAKGPDRQHLRAFAGDLAPALEALPEVRYVEYRYDVEFFRQRGLLLLEADKLRALRGDIAARLRWEKNQANPLFVGLDDEVPASFQDIQRRYAGNPRGEYLESKDGRELYLFVKPRGVAADLAYAQQLLDAVRDVCARMTAQHPEIAIDYTGNFRTRLEEDAIMRQDLGRASLLSTLIAVGIILLATRRGSALLLVGLPVLLGIAVTFAVAQLTIGHLNIVTGFLMAILVGLGLEYGVHLAMRYWEERQLSEPSVAMAAAVRGTFGGAVTSAFTNAAAFLVLVFAKFHAFRQFGIIAAVGVMMSVAAAYALGPAIMALVERFFPGRGRRQNIRPDRELRRLPTAVVASIAGLILVFATFSVFALPRLGFETDMSKLKGRSPSSELADHLSESLGVQTNPAIILVDDLPRARQVTDLIAEVRARHGKAAAFGDAASLNELLPADVAARQREMAALGRLLDKQVPASEKDNPDLAQLRRMVTAQPWTRADLPLEVRRRFEALDGKGDFVLLFPALDLGDARNLEAWAAQMGELVSAADARGVGLHILDGNLIAGRIFSLVKSDGPRILLAAGVVVFLVIVAGVRSLRRALMIAGPLYLGMLCLAGAMRIFGVRLNFINCVVLPNVLVIAVDNAVHLWHRYEEEGPGSLGRVLRHTGLAAVVATIANAAGYASLLIAHHAGLRSIGYLAAFGVFCTFMGTTVFFPAMMALIERARGATRTAASGEARHPPLAA